MKPWKTFVHYFVPNKRNKYQPLFLRYEMGGVVGVVIVVLFAASTATERILVQNGSPQVAAVVASSLVELANADRIQNSLPPLTLNAQLQAAAQLKADDMAAKDYFAHDSPDGRDPWYWFTQAGYNFSYAGENLAVYFSDSDAVNTAWMNSPEHRANILSANFTQIGIATAQGMYQGQETTFVVQEFGTPAAPTAAPTPAPNPVAVITATFAPAAPAPAQTPQVEGASVAPAPKVKVITQDANFIAVKNVNASAPTPASAAPVAPAATPNPFELFFLKFITSPESDLTAAYLAIAAIITMALILEVGIELRRQHPHRIALGLSLVCLMIVLLYAGHTMLFGQLLIA